MDENNIRENQGDIQKNIPYQGKTNRNTVFGLDRNVAFTIFTWTFRIISLLFIFMLWHFVFAPLVPIFKPFLESLFITGQSPLSYRQGGLFLGDVGLFELKNIIILCFLKFAVLTLGLTLVRKAKVVIGKALFL